MLHMHVVPVMSRCKCRYLRWVTFKSRRQQTAKQKIIRYRQQEQRNWLLFAHKDEPWVTAAVTKNKWRQSQSFRHAGCVPQKKKNVSGSVRGLRCTMRISSVERLRGQLPKTLPVLCVFVSVCACVLPMLGPKLIQLDQAGVSVLPRQSGWSGHYDPGSPMESLLTESKASASVFPPSKCGKEAVGVSSPLSCDTV